MLDTSVTTRRSATYSIKGRVFCLNKIVILQSDPVVSIVLRRIPHNAVGGRRAETYAVDNAVLNRIPAYGVGWCRFLRGIHYRVRMLGGKQN